MSTPAHAREARVTEGLPAVLFFVAWFAVWTGLAVFCTYWTARALSSDAVFVHPQLVWMSPVANGVVFGLAGMLLYLAGAAVPVLRSTTVLLAAFFSVGAYSIALLYPRINVFALLILATGIGVQVGRMAARRRTALMPWFRRSLVLGLGLIAAATVVTNLGLAAERRANIAAMGAAEPDSPNVLLVILDTVRSISLGLYGYERPTSPFIDAFAERGVTFENAFSSAPWTLASHGTIFTGHLPFELTAGWRRALDGRHTTIAEHLRSRGYATAGFVANRIFGPATYGLGRGFTHYSGWPIRVGTILDTAPVIRRGVDSYNRILERHYITERRTAEDIVREFETWRSGTDRPWFAFLNLFDAHEPYDPPPPWNTRFGDPQHRRIISERPTPEVIRDLTDAYDGGIAYMDSVLSELFATLEAAGTLDNTLVVITSDHGEHLGEHGLIDHGNSLYAPTLHVPLVMIMPDRIPSGLRVGNAVSLRDLPATLDVLTQSLPDGRSAFPGRPLTRHWSGPGPVGTDTIYAAVEFAPRQPPWYPLARGSMRSVIVWPYHYILNGDGSEELYDLSRDIDEVGPPLDDRAVLDDMRSVMSAFPEHVTARPAAEPPD